MRIVIRLPSALPPASRGSLRRRLRWRAWIAQQAGTIQTKVRPRNATLAEKGCARHPDGRVASSAVRLSRAPQRWVRSVLRSYLCSARIPKRVLLSRYLPDDDSCTLSHTIREHFSTLAC